MSSNRLAVTLLLLLSYALSHAQEERSDSFVDFQYFHGSIMEHNEDMLHLITGHPNGFIVSWNKKTNGNKEWHQLYNYPDYGVSFIYQDLKNEYLGENLGIFAHYNFYFLNRNLIFRVGQGIGYSTNPYDKETNFRNNVHGTRLLSSTYFALNYSKDRIIDRWGMNLGLSLIHYSNANIKAPNTSTNSIVATLGATYDLDAEPIIRKVEDVSMKFTERIRYNFVFRSGVNESDIVGSGQFPFFVGSFYADKRINKKSALQIGADVFFSDFLIEYNRHRVDAFPWEDRTGQEDYRRVGVFAGHELFIGKLSFLTQFGYYVVYPIEYEDEIYHRIGIKRYFGKKIFAAVTLKTHWAKAEALELGIGYRL